MNRPLIRFLVSYPLLSFYFSLITIFSSYLICFFHFSSFFFSSLISISLMFHFKGFSTKCPGPLLKPPRIIKVSRCLSQPFFTSMFLFGCGYLEWWSTTLIDGYNIYIPRDSMCIKIFVPLRKKQVFCSCGVFSKLPRVSPKSFFKGQQRINPLQFYMAQIEPTFLGCGLHREGAYPPACPALACFFCFSTIILFRQLILVPVLATSHPLPIDQSVLRGFGSGSHAVCPRCERRFGTWRPFCFQFSCKVGLSH